MNVRHARGWWNLTCWNGLSDEQQRRLVEHGNLPIGHTPDGPCLRGAEVEVTCVDDVAPGPRFYCRPCAALYLAPPEHRIVKLRRAYTGTVKESYYIDAEVTP